MVHYRLKTAGRRRTDDMALYLSVGTVCSAMLSLVLFDICRCYGYYWLTFLLLWLPLLLGLEVSRRAVYIPLVATIVWLDAVSQSHFGYLTLVYALYALCLTHPVWNVDSQQSFALGLICVLCSGYVFFL